MKKNSVQKLFRALCLTMAMSITLASCGSPAAQRAALEKERLPLASGQSLTQEQDGGRQATLTAVDRAARTPAREDGERAAGMAARTGQSDAEAIREAAAVQTAAAPDGDAAPIREAAAVQPAAAQTDGEDKADAGDAGSTAAAPDEADRAPESTPAPEEPVYTYTDVLHEPTCEEQGYTEHVCAEDAARTWRDAYVDALGHKAGPATLVKMPYGEDDGLATAECVRCGQPMEIRIPSARFVTSGQIPTCVMPGYIRYQFLDYPELDYSVPVAPFGHDFQEGACTRCGEKDPDFAEPEEKEEEKQPEPKPGEQETKPTPEPGEQEKEPEPTPAPGEQETKPTPEPGEQEKEPEPTPVPGGQETKPTPEPGGQEKEPEPTPVPGEQETKPTPEPSPEPTPDVQEETCPNGEHHWVFKQRIDPQVGVEGKLIQECKACGATREQTLPAIPDPDSAEYCPKAGAARSYRHNFGEESHQCTWCGAKEPGYEDSVYYEHFTAAKREEVIQGIFAGTNAVRSGCGRSALWYDGSLQALADERANQLLADYSHGYAANGRTEAYLFDLLEKYGLADAYDYHASENIGRASYVFSKGAQFANAWAASPGHFDTQISAEWDATVVGAAYDPEQDMVYAVQIFLSRKRGAEADEAEAVALTDEPVEVPSAETALTEAQEEAENADAQAQAAAETETAPETANDAPQADAAEPESTGQAADSEAASQAAETETAPETADNAPQADTGAAESTGQADDEAARQAAEQAADEAEAEPDDAGQDDAVMTDPTGETGGEA